MFLLVSMGWDTAQAFVFLLVSMCCDTVRALVFLLVSMCYDTAQVLVFLLVSMCCDTAQALVFFLVSVCCDTARALVFLPVLGDSFSTSGLSRRTGRETPLGWPAENEENVLFFVFLNYFLMHFFPCIFH